MYETTLAEENVDLMGVDNVNVTEFKIALDVPTHSKGNYGYIVINNVSSPFMGAMVNTNRIKQEFSYGTNYFSMVERKIYNDNWTSCTISYCSKWWSGDTISSIKIKMYSGDYFDIDTKLIIFGR